MSLTWHEARAVSDRVRERATELGATVTIAIVDAGGHLQVLDRMDGANPLSARIAPAKAAGVGKRAGEPRVRGSGDDDKPAFSLSFPQLNRAGEIRDTSRYADLRSVGCCRRTG